MGVYKRSSPCLSPSLFSSSLCWLSAQVPEGCDNCGLPDHPNCGWEDCTESCFWCKAGDLGRRQFRNIMLSNSLNSQVARKPLAGAEHYDLAPMDLAEGAFKRMMAKKKAHAPIY